MADQSNAQLDDGELVVARYRAIEEVERLTVTPIGCLERLRTWDVLERLLPAEGVVFDIGGAGGIHAEWLADHGYNVDLFDLLPHHVERAAAVAERSDNPFTATVADARAIPRPDASADIVLLLGPLYHLIEPAERRRCLDEAARLLRSGGLLVVAGISRFAWLLAAYGQGMAVVAEAQRSITYCLQTGRSQEARVLGSFWAYFHRPEELVAEVAAAGFNVGPAIGLEGFAGNLPDLGEILADEQASVDLLGHLRTIEEEPSLVGSSPHFLVAASR